MNEDQLRRLLEEVRAGRTPVPSAIKALRELPFESLGFATIDHHRSLRCGFPEVIYCPGKTTAQVLSIAAKLLATGNNLLATRAEPALFRAFKKKIPKARYCRLARTITVRQVRAKPSPHTIAIVSAGTSDLPVAEEARITAEIMDQKTQTIYDVGIAGLHRLLAHVEALHQARVIVVVAGMEGALPSVVGGLVSVPVIAVPTSIGYGANFQGVAPLLAMLNSCSSGVSVVNIDNGFSAGYIAAQINRQAGPD